MTITRTIVQILYVISIIYLVLCVIFGGLYVILGPDLTEKMLADWHIPLRHKHFFIVMASGLTFFWVMKTIIERMP